MDSPIFEPSHILEHELREALGPLAALFTKSSWFFAEKFAQKDLALWTPATAVPLRNATLKRCHIAALAGLRDTIVPVKETELLTSLYMEHNDVYSVREHHQGPAACGAATHAVMAAWRPDEYRAKLCHFWSQTFGLKFIACNLNILPEFGMDVFARPGWREEPQELRYG